MVSYQPNGMLYEGDGVSTDVELHNTMEDKMGLTDSFLEKAKEYITGKK